MNHYIIVKFYKNIDYFSFVKPITELFNPVLNIKGVKDIIISLSNSKLSNRHHLMIKMQLTQDALLEFDKSEIHKNWKDIYGRYIENKVIFDCD